MSARVSLALAVLLVPALAAAEGFVLQLQPEETAPEKAPAARPDAAPAPATPAPAAASPIRRPAPHRAVRTPDWKPLRGTGGDGRATRWGLVEAVSPSEAAEQRVGIRGDELEYPDRIHFFYDSIRFRPGAEQVLPRIADLLQATPEIRRLWIEGHADATGAEDYNQALSEARASAVREALVRAGVAPERLVAYGFGESRLEVSAARPEEKNRRVVLRLVEADRPALEARQPGQWGRAAVVWTSGEVEGAATPTSDDGSADVQWAPVAARDALPEGVDVFTGPTGRVLLRLPDLTRVVLGPDTHIRLGKVFYDAAAGRSWLAVRVRRGTLRARVNPTGALASNALFSFAGGALETGLGVIELRVSAEGRGRATVLEGTASVSTGGATSAALGAGEWLTLGDAAARPARLVDEPTVLGPLDGVEPGRATRFTWRPTSGATGYRLEIAADPDFERAYAAHETGPEPQAVLTELPPDAAWWRVRALTPDAPPGLPSTSHRVR